MRSRGRRLALSVDRMTEEQPTDIGTDSDRMTVTERAVILIRQEYWVLWAEVAIREAQAAARANATVTSQTVSDHDRVAAMWLELQAGTQSICAAAFSVEALCYVLRCDVVSAATLAKWQNTWPGGMAVMHRTLQNALSINRAASITLRTDFEAVIRSRNEAAHYDIGFEAPVRVPGGGLGSPAIVRFGAANALSALDVVKAIYQALVDHPVPALQPFVDSNRQTLIGIAQGQPHRLH